MKQRNPFKTLGHPPKEVPKDLKESVMREVEALKLLTDMTSLFTKGYGNTMGNILFQPKNSNEHKTE
ncbi:hypothetical protein MTsPCn5_38100 [Croceitalea sp. MTPC5]|uniref:hypothetical protein n=1 Tax=Croceitalea sp. MTPC5 TaxID=3056565 RepID=UPI002B3FDEED|nr:hypothetical protein MTsPCn5_38100 [Croceitalea sp. MTPC5]